MHLTRLLRVGVIIAANLVATAVVAQESQLSGRVTDERTGDGIAGTRVLLTGTLGILNALRAGAGLADTTDPGTPAGRVDLLFRERAFWLFATGHRLGDLRRLVRQYGRAADAVFPSGLYFKGGLTYGPGVNLPLPATETNNPKVTGCLDRNA